MTTRDGLGRTAETTWLLYDDALRSRELRHEIAEPIGDPIGFIEHEGRRIAVAGILEEPILAKREDIVDEVWSTADLGVEELVRDGSMPESSIGPEIVRRALAKLSVEEVCVPGAFAVATADYLRERGITVTVDDDAWMDRRRRKAPWELEGIERAQRAAETAMLSAARMLREAERTTDGRLRFEGEILTAEWIREAMVAELLSQGADSEEIIVHSGDAWAGGHDPGYGPISPDATCIIDCFPMDRRTGAYSDMTRTFVPGIASAEVQQLFKHCREALDLAFASLKPGTSDAYAKVADYLNAEGFATQRHHDGETPLRDGFFHALGHGVGLDVHERPWMGRRSDPLLVGDVIAVEPGVYVRGVGGVRLEDTVIVTESGVEHFTDPFPYDLEPV